jgi:hypothetical protein
MNVHTITTISINIAIFVLFLFCAPSKTYAQFMNKNNNNKNFRNRRQVAQRNYNDELMKKNTININDRIYYNKVVTTPFIESICPLVSDLVFKDETGLYELGQIDKEEFRALMVQNVSHAFLSEVYTSKNYPTHRHDINLDITIEDIYKYNKNHCKKYYAHYIYQKKEARQRVHEYHIEKTNVITIDQRPYHHIKDYEFQKPLCGIINNYKRMNESFSSRESFINSLVSNITQEYMIQIYTLANFEKLYKNDAVLQNPSENDINLYYQEHCKHLYEANYYAYLTSAVFGTTAVALITVL